MNTTIHTASYVDLPRYLGTWYEIARKPQHGDNPDARDRVWNFTRDSDEPIHVSHSYIGERDALEESSGVVRVSDSAHARFSISFMPDWLQWVPFTREKFWILGIDDDYTTALIGEPGMKRLHLLHRHAQMDRTVATGWIEAAQQQGYDTSDIVWPEQSGTIYLNQVQ